MFEGNAQQVRCSEPPPAGQSDSSEEFQRDGCRRRASPAAVVELGRLGIPNLDFCAAFYGR